MDPPALPCPDENTVAMFVRGELTADEVTTLEAHLDTCPACAQVIVEAARLFGEPASRVVAGATLISGAATRGAADWLAAGERVGRYRVLEPIGAGGMGVVYAAYDPELDRRVALKLLHVREDAGTEGRARLQREAQALARLSHPNVVAIHDVGTLGDRLFLAMEFVDGRTLRRWLAEAPREWPEIRDVFVAAGRGLAAAHAAGLVHRDFKPDNVLIDREGRVRVTDFGLARRSGERGPEPTLGEPTLQAGETLTQSGALVGTPAYMAPEQFDGNVLDAASDQYSFCVTLYEALWRTRPHAAKSLHEMMIAVQTAEPREPPRDGRVPAPVRAAILRGLSRDRAQRFADIGALLAILQRDPQRARRQALLWAMPAAVVATVAVAWAGREAGGPEFCRTDPLASVWRDDERERARGWFDDAAVPYAAEASASFERSIDAYAERFDALHERACSPRTPEDAAPGVDALRMLCLEERRALLRATLDVLATSTAGDRGRTLLANAPRIAEALPSLDACDDVGRTVALRGEQVPPTLASAVIDARARLAEVTSVLLGGDYDDALARVDSLVVEIEALQFAPLQAELHLARGRVLEQLANFAEARTELEQAAELATRAGDRITAAEALVELVFVFGQSGGQVELADFTAHLARAAIEGVGMPATLSGKLHRNLATVRLQGGSVDDAIAELEAALALSTPADSPIYRIEVLLDLAKIETTGLRFEAAAAHMAECRALVAEGLGAGHPAMADVAFAEGLIAVTQLQWDAARVAFERALAIRRAAVGENHPDYASDLSTVGQMLVMQATSPESVAEGIADLRKAVEIYDRNYGADHIMTLNVGMRLAHSLLMSGDAAAAATMAKTVLARTEKVLDPSHPAIAAGLGVLADAETTLGHHDEAIAIRRREIEASMAAHGETHVYVALAHGALGEALYRAGRLREAIEPLQHSVDLTANDEVAAADGAWFVVLLARARREVGEPDPNERKLVEQAIARLEAGADPQRAAEAREWLATVK